MKKETKEFIEKQLTNLDKKLKEENVSMSISVGEKKIGELGDLDIRKKLLELQKKNMEAIMGKKKEEPVGMEIVLRATMKSFTVKKAKSSLGLGDLVVGPAHAHDLACLVEAQEMVEVIIRPIQQELGIGGE